MTNFEEAQNKKGYHDRIYLKDVSWFAEHPENGTYVPG